MLAARRESEFAAALDQLAEAFPKSLPLAKFWAALYAEINRESKYFDALVRLFDLNMASDQLPGACEAVEKLVEIDPYDARNQERLDQLKGRASEDFLSRVKSRLSNAATHRSEPPVQEQRRARPGEPSTAILKEVDSTQTLEDLLVQAEIFVQYSLQSKAIERLQRIMELFPGEEENNERLQGLFEAAHWWPEEGAVSRRPVDANASGSGGTRQSARGCVPVRSRNPARSRENFGNKSKRVPAALAARHALGGCK